MIRPPKTRKFRPPLPRPLDQFLGSDSSESRFLARFDIGTNSVVSVVEFDLDIAEITDIGDSEPDAVLSDAPEDDGNSSDLDGKTRLPKPSSSR